MSRKLLCPDCDKNLSKLADKFNEVYESVEGKANADYRCDDCGADIEKGENCFASCLLPDRSHFNYEWQQPEAWMEDFITPLTSANG